MEIIDCIRSFQNNCEVVDSPRCFDLFLNKTSPYSSRYFRAVLEMSFSPPRTRISSPNNHNTHGSRHSIDSVLSDPEAMQMADLEETQGAGGYRPLHRDGLRSGLFEPSENYPPSPKTNPCVHIQTLKMTVDLSKLTNFWPGAAHLYSVKCKTKTSTQDDAHSVRSTRRPDLL